MTRVFPLLLMVACSDKDGGPIYADYDVGTATACLELGDAATAGAETESIDLTGQVYDDDAGTLTGNLHPCGAVSRVLTILGDDGGIYELGYGVTDADGKDITRKLDVVSGDDVYLHFVSVESFGSASGFVLQDNDSVIAALEVGTWGPALEPGAVPGLTVSAGEVVGGGNTECGATAATEILFAGDAERSARPVEDLLITVSGEALNAYAVAAWEYTEADCTDVAGAFIWGVFR